MPNLNSNNYTLMFASIIVLVSAIFLTIISVTLRPIQELNAEVDMKKNILKAFELYKEGDELSADEIQSKYDDYVKQIFVDSEGKRVENPSKKEKENLLEVYLNEEDGKIKSYAIPVEGKGLWSTIYGYISLEDDLNTVLGLTFYKQGETPGLGAEIEKPIFTDNFKGKKIYKDDKLVSITVMKGKVDPNSPNIAHQVDGISGATLTCKGVEEFLKEDLKKYEPYFEKASKKGGM